MKSDKLFTFNFLGGAIFLEKNLEFIIEEEKLQKVLKILNEEILKNSNVSVVAQKLLNNGNLKGIKDLFDISIGRKIYGGEYDE